jgi:hypothetical protein
MNSFPRPYLDHGTPITIEKRAVVVDWLVSIHRRFQCPSDESLYLAVNLFDRYIAETVHNYTNDDVQLVGATCLLIATKFEEIDQPTIKELVKVASRRFSRRNLVDMECEILSQLAFALNVPTGLPFLHRFLFLSKASVAAGDASKYYMERLLLEHESLGEPPSLLAVACVCLALNHPQIRANDEDLNTTPGIVSRISCRYQTTFSHDVLLLLSAAHSLALHGLFTQGHSSHRSVRRKCRGRSSLRQVEPSRTQRHSS